VLLHGHLRWIAVIPAHPVLAGGRADDSLAAVEGAGSGQGRDSGDGGVHAHAHLMPWHEVAQANTGSADTGHEGAFVTVMSRDRLHLCPAERARIGDDRARVTACGSAREHQPLLHLEHEAIIGAQDTAQPVPALAA
jgi:hypothetical protein